MYLRIKCMFSEKHTNLVVCDLQSSLFIHSPIIHPCLTNQTVHLKKSFKKHTPSNCFSLRFGVYQGESLNFMARLLKAARPPVKLYGFDSFQGLPAVTWLKNGCLCCVFARMASESREICLSVLCWAEKWLVSKPFAMYTYIFICIQHKIHER